MIEENAAVSDIVWTPARGENEPDVRSISWNNLLLSDEVYGGKFLTSAEVRINPDTALQSTVFLACCRIISETVAGLPLLVYRRLKNGHEEVASEIPLSHVLGFAPNAWQTKFEFFEQMLMALTCWGNSYTEVKSGRYGSVTELNNLHPSRMRVERLENGRLKYSYNDPQTGRLLQYTQDQVMHVRWTPEPDGVKGMVPVEVSRDAIALARACEIYASKFWANMGRPGVVLQTDGALSAETAERLRENWERIHRGVQNAHRTAILTNGLKIEPFGATNNDSQFLEVRKFQCEEIARCFRLPLHLIQGQSGGNLEIQGQEFINYTLMPWLSRIEQAISRSLIYDDATYYAKFDVKGLLRGDSGSRASYYSTMMNLGVLSINDVRLAEGLGPIGPEADKHLVAMNLQPLEEAVKPKPDPSMMPGFGSGAPPKAPGGPPSLSEVKTGKAPLESPKGEDSAKQRSESRELLPQDEKLGEAQQEIADEDGKWSKAASHYIEKNPFASRGIKCHNCTHYVEEGGCKVVSGTIDGDAICRLWVIPQEKIAQEPEQRAFCATGPGGGIDNSCGLSERQPFKPIGDSKNTDNAVVPTDEELSKALTGSNSAKGTKIGKARDLPAGTPVALRIDIPAFNWSKKNMGKAIYAVTVHEDKGGKSFGSPIGYEPMARLSGPVTFASQEASAEKVASGEHDKHPLATVKGSFDPDRTIPADLDQWTAVGYNPKKAAYFYDKKTGQEVMFGTDAVSVGNTVFVRVPKYGPRNAAKQYRSLDEMRLSGSWGIEIRGFCPTGPGGGIDNSCGAKQMMAPDGTGGGGSSSAEDSEEVEANKKIGNPKDLPDVGFSLTSDSKTFLEERNKSGRPENFSDHAPEDLDAARKFLSQDRRTGYIITPDGDFGNLFNNKGPNGEKLPGAGKAAIVEGVKNGALTLDCYNGQPGKKGFLPILYSKYGYEPVAKLKWNDDYAPPGWDYESKGRPDVIVMAYKGGDRSTIQDRAGTFPRYQPPKEYSDDFDAAKQRARELADKPARHDRKDAEGRAGGVQGSCRRDERLGYPGGVRTPEEPVGVHPGLVELRDDCVRDPSGRFGEGNKCQEGAGTGGDKQSTPRVVVNVAQQAISSPATTRSDDGKSIVSSSVGSREDGTIYKFAGREYVSTTAAGKYLSERQAESRGPAIDSAKPLGDKDREYVADSHVSQIQAAAGRGIKPVFYTPEERQRQIEEFSRIEPRINGGRTKAGFEVSPENAEFLFRAVQALTSSNASPFANMQRTDSVLSKVFDGDGRVSTSTSFGVTGGAIKKSLSRLQGVIDTLGRRTDGSIDPAMGLDKTRELFTGVRMRAGDFDKFFKAEFKGDGPSVKSWKPGSFLVDQEVPLFCTFGPKFGCFFANNTGDSAPLTADIWATRTWGRITGELVQEAKSGKAKDHAKETLRAIKSANAEQLHGIDGNQIVDSLTKMSVTGEIDDTVRAWSSARLRHYASTDYSEKRGTAGKLNKLAKNIVENDTSLMGDPGSGKRRANMIDVYDSISKATGLPVAYAQDVLWQDEQDAYAALGAKTATEQGKLSFYSDQIRRIAQDPSTRIGMAKGEKARRRDSQQPAEYYDDYESGGRENLLYWEMISHLSDEQFVKILLDIDGSPAERRAFCPTGEGGGVKNDCSPKDSSGSGVSAAPPPSPAPSSGSGPEINVGDKREEIDRRLESMGVAEDDVIGMAGGASDGTYVFMRRDHDHEGGDGIHVETTRDVGGVKDGMFSQSVIYNAGSASDPELVVDHKLMDVKTEVSRDPEKRHAAAREFFRVMTDSVQASVRQGVSVVKLNAAGDPRQARDGMFRGYTIWPRMGFDAPIPYYLRNKLPEPLSHCRSLLDLHATPEGTRWWRDNGTDLDVQLDLTRADSPQMQVFGKFVRHFMRERRDAMPGEGIDWLSPEDTAKLDELWEEIWDEGLLDDYDGGEENFSKLEKRAFCPTGKGGGIKNDCSASDGDSTSAEDRPAKELDNSWQESDEMVELWERDDLAQRPPIEGAEKLHSFAIENPAEMKSAIDEIGVSLSDAVTMCAAPSEGTTVIASPEHPYDSMGLATYGEDSKAVVFVMTTKDIAGIAGGLDSNSSLRKTNEGELVLEYHAFYASKEAQDKAAVACAKEVIGGVIKSVSLAEKSGVSEIRLDAAGSKDHKSFKGYRIWPKFGFDGVIPRKMLTRLREQDLSPRALAEKRAGKLTIQALYETKEGQQYWEERGQEIPMWLRPGDKSTPGWERFMAYRQKLGKLAENRSFGAGDGIFSAEELKKLDEMWEEIRKNAEEHRAFCPTGEGNGVDNSCSPKMAADKDSGGGSVRTPEKPKVEEASWGQTEGTEVWRPSRPLFKGAESIGEIHIEQADQVREIVNDLLKTNISDAVHCSGHIVDSVQRVGLTLPRMHITPVDTEKGTGIEMTWTCRGVTNGSGYAADEKIHAERPGTVVEAASAVRELTQGRGASLPVLELIAFGLHPDFRGKGIAAEMVAKTISSPVSFISMGAARVDHPDPKYRMTGYADWVKYGYDAPIEEVKRILESKGVGFPKEFSRARSLLGLHAIPGGADFWRENGDNIDLVFDLRPRSMSRATFEGCMERIRQKAAKRSLPENAIRPATGSDCDYDEDVEGFWADVQKSGQLEGSPIDDQYYKEAKDGKAREV